MTSAVALPKRLILELDGISYRDMKALQAGVTYTNHDGQQFHRQAFTNGYFSVSRNVSTFPSTSDVAWTDIFGDRPLPGYQRTYFSVAENRLISRNPLTSSMEHERQVDWQLTSGFDRAMAYVYPLHAFKYELRAMGENYLKSKSTNNFYVYIRSTDDAQHTSGDIFAMLCMLDQKVEELRARYQASEGHDLEILIVSDHGHNHAGPGKRVQVRSFLKQSGYRVAKSIQNEKDVVLPTCGIESWVEIHNSPGETEKLAELLWHLKGVDLLTARVPEQTNQFLVINSKGERAVIDWNPAQDSYRYTPESGDPLGYQPVIAALAQKNLLDANGFASADAWMNETMTCRYPLALERIVQGQTRITLNPANILISLSNEYVHSGWLVRTASGLMTTGGTHGNLDDINSDGIVMTNFKPTKDTSTGRVAAQFDGFQGLRNFRAEENGAEWVTGQEQALTRIARTPLDSTCRSLPGDGVFLRVWTPAFANLGTNAAVKVTVERKSRHRGTPTAATDVKPHPHEQSMALAAPIQLSGGCAYERVYPLPAGLVLEPDTAYRISGQISVQDDPIQVFNFIFKTDNDGKPVAY